MTKLAVLATMLLLSIAAVQSVKIYRMKDCPYEGEQDAGLPTSSSDWHTYLVDLGKLRLALSDPFLVEMKYGASFVTLQFFDDQTWTIEFYTMLGEFMTMSGHINSVTLVKSKEWRIQLDGAKQLGADVNIFTIEGADKTIDLFVTKETDDYVFMKATQKAGVNCYEARYMFLKEGVDAETTDFSCLGDYLTTILKLTSPMHVTGVLSC